MFKGLMLLSVSTGVKFASSTLIFLFAASQWPSAVFGQFMYGFAIASLIVLATELGFVQQLLKSVGSHPQNVNIILGDLLSTKLWLIVVVLALIFILPSSLMIKQGIDYPVFVMVLVSLILASISDLMLTAHRALSRFYIESKLSVSTNLLTIIFLVSTLLIFNKPFEFAAAMLTARVLQLALIAFFTQSLIRGYGFVGQFFAIKRRYQTTKDSIPYAADSGITTVLSNVDTLFISYLLGASATGVYQAAARFTQGVGVLFSVISSFFLPKFSKIFFNNENSADLGIKFQWVVLGGWLLLSLGLIAFYFVYSTYPTETTFHRAAPLLLAVILLAGMRFIAGLFGTYFIALGLQRKRVAYYFITLLIFIVLAPVLISLQGLWGPFSAFSLAYAFLITLSFFELRKYRVKLKYFMLLIGLVYLLLLGILQVIIGEISL